MEEILNKIRKTGIIPVVKIDRASDAVPLGKALCEGGLEAAEITFRTSAAKEAIEKMSAAFPEMVIGAGTVLTPNQADEAMTAGATFIVSPGLNPEVVSHCLEKGYPIIPGVCTPSDIEKALSLGLTTVKFFPAEASGGIGMIKAMSAPYTNVKFMPTGGINQQNIDQYLSNPKVLACGGSFMVPSDLINSGDFDTIRRLTEEAVKNMLGFELAHVGINTDSSSDAENITNEFERLFGFPKEERKTSFFARDIIEIMKPGGRGKFGHIAIRTKNIERAMYYLEKKGVKFAEESFDYDSKSRLVSAYSDKEIGGFAIHLVTKY